MFGSRGILVGLNYSASIDRHREGGFSFLSLVVSLY